MGFKDVKAKVLACLASGAVLHEQRGDIDIKNLLATGQVSLEELIAVIARSRGHQYSSSPHHWIDGIEVHILKTRRNDENWYVKWYFVEPNTVFISVHH